MAYRGTTTTIPLGGMGLLTDLAPGTIPYTALIGAKNISYGAGFIQKAEGSLKYNSTPLDSNVMALFDYWPNTSTQRLFAATKGGKIYRDIGDRLFSLNVPVATGLGTLTNNSMFVEGGQETSGRSKKLFFFSAGQAQVQVLAGDGTTFAPIATPAADWTSPNYPRFGLIHRNRMWAFMKQFAYASDTGDHENFTSNFLFDNVGPGEGGDILAAYVYKGRMFVFKEGDFVYYLVDTDPDSDNWYFTKLGEGFGVASTHAALQILDDLAVGNATGSMTSLTAVNAFGDVASGDIYSIAKIADYFRANTTQSAAPFMHTLYYPDKKTAFFTTRTKYRTENDAMIVLDASQSGNPRYAFWSEKDYPECLALRRDINKIQRPIYGNHEGYVMLMDRENRNVGGVAYTGEFKTPHLDFRHLDPGLAHKNKNFDFLGVNFVQEGNHDLQVDVFIDGKFSETLAFRQTISSNYMGSFVLGESTLGQEEEQTIWKPLHGSGRRISFRCYNENLDQNFRACLLTIGFRAAGEDATRLD